MIFKLLFLVPQQISVDNDKDTETDISTINDHLIAKIISKNENDSDSDICIISSDDDDDGDNAGMNANKSKKKVKIIEPVIARVESAELIKSHLEKLNGLYTHSIPISSSWINNKYIYF